MSQIPAAVFTLSATLVSAIRDHKWLQHIVNAMAIHGDDFDSEFDYAQIDDTFLEIAKVDDDDTAWYDGDEHSAMWKVFDDMAKTEKEQVEHDRLRRVLEQHATAFATRCGHKVGTREYILAARKALEEARDAHEDQFNGERRMERAATSRACGVCDDDHYSNEDYLSSEFHKDVEWMQDVLNWLEENCPLLMLKIAEEPAPAE